MNYPSFTSPLLSSLFVNSLIHLDQRCDLVGSCKYVIQFIFLVIHLDWNPSQNEIWSNPGHTNPSSNQPSLSSVDKQWTINSSSSSSSTSSWMKITFFFCKNPFQSTSYGFKPSSRCDLIELWTLQIRHPIEPLYLQWINNGRLNDDYTFLRKQCKLHSIDPLKTWTMWM